MAVSEAQPDRANRLRRRYLAGSVIVAFLHSVLSLLTMEDRGSETPLLIVQFCGALIGTVVLAAIIYWISRLVTHGNRSKSTKIMFWGLIASFLLFLVTFVRNMTDPQYRTRDQITAEERQGLHVGPDSIRHESLGFSMPNPGVGFVRYQEDEPPVSKSRPDIMFWSFEDSAQQMDLTIQVTAIPSLDEETFRSFARGLSQTGEGDTVLADTLTWTDTLSEYILRLRTPEGVVNITRCVPRLIRKKLVVCVEMVGFDSTKLTAVPKGLTINPLRF